jgi:hypothetical protein
MGKIRRKIREWRGGSGAEVAGECEPGEVEIPCPRRKTICKAPDAVEVWAKKCGLGSVPEAVSELTGLERLDLESNAISKIENLEGLESLKVLDLTSNEISEIENLEGLGSLEMLRLKANDITEIEGLEDLDNLERLDLNNNGITEIKNLEGLGSLEALYLSRNPIERIGDHGSAVALKQMLVPRGVLHIGVVSPSAEIEGLLEELYRDAEELLRGRAGEASGGSGPAGSQLERVERG